MRVVPISTALEQRILVDEDLLGRDRKTRDVRDAVHSGGHQEAVPVNRRRLVGEGVLHFDTQHRTLAQANLRAGVLSVDHDPRHRPLAVRVHRLCAHPETVFGWAGSWYVSGLRDQAGLRRSLPEPGLCPRDQTARNESCGPHPQQAAPGHANRTVAVLVVHRESSS